MDAIETAREEVQLSMCDVRTALARQVEALLVLLGHLIAPAVREHPKLTDVSEVTLTVNRDGFPHGFSVSVDLDAETVVWAVERLQSQPEIYNLLSDLVWCLPDDGDENADKIVIRLPAEATA